MFNKTPSLNATERSYSAEEYAQHARKIVPFNFIARKEDKLAYANYYATMAVYEKLCELTKLNQ